jgi:hypothetical protein
MGTANMLLGAAGPFLYFRTIYIDQVDYNLYNELIAAGWDGQRQVNVNLEIYVGVRFSSSSNIIPAFSVGPLPANSSVYITNRGTIVGRGGQGVGKGYPLSTDYNLTAPSYANGGTAFVTTVPVSIDNLTGTIGGGGGGGGVGGSTAADCSCSGCGGVNLVGMSIGGGGAGFGSAGVGYSWWKNNAGFWSPLTASEAGLAITPGGSFYAAYSSGTRTAGGTGGTGGDLGQPGNPGTGAARCGYTNQSGPGTGGAAGACTSGNTYINWINTGFRAGALN